MFYLQRHTRVEGDSAIAANSTAKPRPVEPTAVTEQTHLLNKVPIALLPLLHPETYSTADMDTPRAHLPSLSVL